MVVATVLKMDIGFEVDKRALVAYVFDVDDGRGDVMAEVRVDDDCVVGGLGHCPIALSPTQSASLFY